MSHEIEDKKQGLRAEREAIELRMQELARREQEAEGSSAERDEEFEVARNQLVQAQELVSRRAEELSSREEEMAQMEQAFKEREQQIVAQQEQANLQSSELQRQALELAADHQRRSQEVIDLQGQMQSAIIVSTSSATKKRKLLEDAAGSNVDVEDQDVHVEDEEQQHRRVEDEKQVLPPRRSDFKKRVHC